MGERVPLTILDSNAWLDCFRRAGHEERRRRLVRAARARRVRPLLTRIVVAELARGYRDGVEVDRETVLRFAWNACGARILIEPSSRKEGELRFRRPLRESELLADAHGFRDQILRLDFAQRIDAALRDGHAEHRENQREHHEATIARLSRERLIEALGTPQARRELAESWALDVMAEKAIELGLPATALPEPSKLPSFFAPKVVHVERIARVLIEGRSRVHPGMADTDLLAEALACGRIVLVTSDGPLLDVTARAAPLFPRFAFVDANAWFAAL